MPVDPIVLLAFIPAALALNLTPGADMMFCLGQGLRKRRRNEGQKNNRINRHQTETSNQFGIGPRLTTRVAPIMPSCPQLSWICPQTASFG